MNDETLVYDKLSHKAHCLNPLAALVWKLCDGRRSKEELADVARQNLGVPVDANVIELTLHELSKIDLLAQATTMPSEKKQYSRREMARTLGVGSAAALLLAPLVSSIMTQSAMAQASPVKKTTAPTTTTTVT
jgi:hypothetical protein